MTRQKMNPRLLGVIWLVGLAAGLQALEYSTPANRTLSAWEMRAVHGAEPSVNDCTHSLGAWPCSDQAATCARKPAGQCSGSCTRCSNLNNQETHCPSGNPKPWTVLNCQDAAQDPTGCGFRYAGQMICQMMDGVCRCNGGDPTTMPCEQKRATFSTPCTPVLGEEGQGW
jgi:hypothetical protein